MNFRQWFDGPFKKRRADIAPMYERDAFLMAWNAGFEESERQHNQALAAAEQRGYENMLHYVKTWEPLLLSFSNDTERETFERLVSELADSARHYFSMPKPEAGPR